MHQLYPTKKITSPNVKRWFAVFMTVLLTQGIFMQPALSSFKHVSAAPVITSFFPAFGATGSAVRITGTHLTGATAVSFGGVAASSFTVVSDVSILAVVGIGATGSIVVVTPGGRATAAGFTFVEPLNLVFITSFAPDSAGTGTTVRISGGGFTNSTSVSFGGVPAQSFSILGDTVINAVVGTGASGAVYVVAPDGSDSLDGFTYVPISDAVLKPAGIEQPLAVYPNPATGYLLATPPNTLVSSKFLLADMSGKVLRTIPVSQNVSQVRIDLSGLSEGLYKLIWSDRTNTLSKTILIKR